MILTLDFETYYGTGYNLQCMNDSKYVRHAQFKPFGIGVQADYNEPHWVEGDTAIRLYLDELDWNEITLICHNTLFDGFILAERYGKVPRFYCDTLGMARCLHFFASHRLGDLAKQYGLDGKTKQDALADLRNVRDPSPEQLKALGEYCIDDVVMTRKLFDFMIDDIPQKEMHLMDHTIRLMTQPRLHVDISRAEHILQNEEKERTALLTELGVTTKDLNSNAKLAGLLRARGVKPPMKISPTTGEPTYAMAVTDSEFQALRHDDRAKDLIDARIRIKSNIVPKRTQALVENSINGQALPVGLNYWGAVTGRWTGTNGYNMQNLPKEGGVRHCVIAPPEHVLVVCDASQIECRLLAWFSKQTNLLDTFRSGGDPYCEFGSVYYGREITKADEAERFIAKSAVLGLGYGMAGDRFYNDVLSKAKVRNIPITLTQEEANTAVDTYRTMFPHIPAMWRNADGWIATMGMDDGYAEWQCIEIGHDTIYLPNGTYIRYPNMDKGDFESVNRDGSIATRHVYGSHLIENIIQALARIVVSNHILAIHEKLPVVMHTHDEIVAIAHEKEADDAVKLMIDIMREPPSWCFDIPLDAEAKYKRYYSK